MAARTSSPGNVGLNGSLATVVVLPPPYSRHPNAGRSRVRESQGNVRRPLTPPPPYHEVTAAPERPPQNHIIAASNPRDRSFPSTTRSIRMTVLCAKNLSKGGSFSMFPNFTFSLPDVYCMIEVANQSWTTDTVAATTSPVFRWTRDLTVSKTEQIFISIWNQKQADKKTSSNSSTKGCLGCVRIKPNDVVRLRDTGFQNIALHKLLNDGRPSKENIKGEIVVSIVSKTDRREYKNRLRN